METTLNLNTQRMTSLEIAQVTGKQHKDVLKAIRNMEDAWVKVQGRNFALLQKTYPLPNGGKKMMPYYSLTKTECLYVATKFNDEARAKLVLRWEELELERRESRDESREMKVESREMTDVEIMARAVLISAKQIEELSYHVAVLANEAEYCDSSTSSKYSALGANTAT